MRLKESDKVNILLKWQWLIYEYERTTGLDNKGE